MFDNTYRKSTFKEIFLVVKNLYSLWNDSRVIFYYIDRMHIIIHFSDFRVEYITTCQKLLVFLDENHNSICMLHEDLLKLRLLLRLRVRDK